MIPIAAALLSQGMSILGNAVLAQGQEAVERKLGVQLHLTPPEELKKLEAAHEEFLLSLSVKKLERELEGEKIVQAAVTDRWKFDMLSDSWMSKNVRPLVLVYLTVVVTVMAFCSEYVKVEPAWIELLRMAYIAVITAYFAGRSMEKVTDIREQKNVTR